MTQVVNIRQHPLLVTVYIGRAGRGHDGYFGNPVVIGQPCPECGAKHGRDDTLLCFARYAKKRIDADPEYRSRVAALIGETLGCFCSPLPCHGDILARLADDLTRKEYAS